RLVLTRSLTALAHAAIKGQCHPGGCSLARSRTGGPGMQCTHCHTENRPGRRFCAECGEPLALACASCGFANEPGEKFCGGCGTPLTTAPPPPQPWALPPPPPPQSHGSPPPRPIRLLISPTRSWRPVQPSPGSANRSRCCLLISR